MIKAVFFDLDGTLLPMDQDKFIEAYMGRLVAHMAPRGYEPDKVLMGVGAGIKAMVVNDGSCTNEDRFWQAFVQVLGEKVLEEKEPLYEFYRTEFQKVAESCGFLPEAKATIETLKKMGYPIVLATNPLFPSIATESRMRWAGLEPSDFIYYTTYENSRYCKPNLKYYEEILAKTGFAPEEVLMVGNDVSEDMITEKLGMKVFLLPADLLNKENKDISGYPKGTLQDMLTYLSEL